MLRYSQSGTRRVDHAAGCQSSSGGPTGCHSTRPVLCRLPSRCPGPPGALAVGSATAGVQDRLMLGLQLGTVCCLHGGFGYVDRLWTTVEVERSRQGRAAQRDWLMPRRTLGDRAADAIRPPSYGTPSTVARYARGRSGAGQGCYPLTGVLAALLSSLDPTRHQRYDRHSALAARNAGRVDSPAGTPAAARAIYGPRRRAGRVPGQPGLAHAEKERIAYWHAEVLAEPYINCKPGEIRRGL